MDVNMTSALFLSSRFWSSFFKVASLMKEKTVILVANKSDLPAAADLSGLPWRAVEVSALTGEGIGTLEERMVELVLGGKAPEEAGETLVTTARHKEALVRAARHLDQALEALAAALPEDLVSLDLEAALGALGEITGQTATEDIIERIFARFCVGK